MKCMRFPLFREGNSVSGLIANVIVTGAIWEHAKGWCVYVDADGNARVSGGGGRVVVHQNGGAITVITLPP